MRSFTSSTGERMNDWKKPAATPPNTELVILIGPPSGCSKDRIPLCTPNTTPFWKISPAAGAATPLYIPAICKVNHNNKILCHCIATQAIKCHERCIASYMDVAIARYSNAIHLYHLLTSTLDYNTWYIMYAYMVSYLQWVAKHPLTCD